MLFVILIGLVKRNFNIVTQKYKGGGSIPPRSRVVDSQANFARTCVLEVASLSEGKLFALTYGRLKIANFSTWIACTAIRFARCKLDSG